MPAGWLVLLTVVVGGWPAGVADAESAIALEPTAGQVESARMPVAQGQPDTAKQPPALNSESMTELEISAQDREVIALVLGLAALPLVLLHWQTILAIPGARWWIAALMVRELAWLFTVLESYLLPDLLNFLEHAFLTMSTFLMAIGAWRVYRMPARPVASEA